MFSKRSSNAQRGILTVALMITSLGVAFTQNTVSGTQNYAPPIVTIDPSSLDFNDQVIGRTSQSKRITVKNTGNSPLYVDSVSSAGDNASDFSLANDTCTGATVASNRACIVDVTFTPSDTGERNATVTVTDNAAGSPQSVSLTGTGINSNDVAPF